MEHRIAETNLLVLKEQPSFEGELSIRLVEVQDSAGPAKYSLVCQKKPPFKGEFNVFAGALDAGVGEDLEELANSICWRREIPPHEAKEIMDILEHQVVSIAPEEISGLDGTTYELLIERGPNKVQFRWWCDPPRGWQALGEVSERILNVADAASMIEALQSNTRKQMIKQLQEQLKEAQATQEEENQELIKTHNRHCRELARFLQTIGLGVLVAASTRRIFDTSIRVLMLNPISFAKPVAGLFEPRMARPAAVIL